ncbi:MAG TPA: sigma-70 family RNA polymerase sigma factor [Bryobacteraceae bacterium]|nr:sigma-70 family RNA polymerase sigma factor [Bryobacteraceae bacterium]
MKTAAQRTEQPKPDEKHSTRDFAELLRANQSMVFSIAFHSLRDRAVAEELAQEVFLELYRRLNELESEAHVTYWLRKVTTNRCIDYIRKRKLRMAVSLDSAPEPSSTDDHEDVLMSRKLRALISGLPEKARMIIILRYQEELMPEEIAKVMDMPLGTVKSHLHRSLALLRDKIDRSMGEVR